MTNELSPCPFCNGSAYIDGSERDGFYASCSDCYCCVGEAYDRDPMPDHMFRTEEDAAKQWNARATPAPKTNLVGGHLRAQGIGRDPENDRVVFLSLNRVPSDDELRAIQDAIQRTPATCPFCAKPTYVLPCSHCGEPDVPEHEF